VTAFHQTLIIKSFQNLTESILIIVPCCGNWQLLAMPKARPPARQQRNKNALETQNLLPEILMENVIN